eukprot:g38543.t1
MCIGRYTSQDVCGFFKFVWNLERAWMQVFVVIGKALCEAQGIELFAALSDMAITIFVCFFHTLQAICRYLHFIMLNAYNMNFCIMWLTTSKNKFPQDKVELAILSISKMHYATTTKEYQNMLSTFRKWVGATHKGFLAYMEKEWFTGFWSARVAQSFENASSKKQENKRLDLLHMVCVERMQRICARAMYDVDLTKERKRMFHTVDLATRVYGKDHLLYEHPDTDIQKRIHFVQFGTNIFTVRLGGEFGDGPTCTCKDPDPRLCLHIIIVYYDARVYYTAEQWSDRGWQGNQDDREADDDNSNFDNDDNHDNSQAKTDDELKHVFKEITDGLDVLFEKLRLVP